ncbi:MAG: hypothetical protein ABI145_11295 [Steroidobacteraceae bacterium]
MSPHGRFDSPLEGFATRCRFLAINAQPIEKIKTPLPLPVGAFHACITFREAVAVIGLIDNIAQQLVHRLVEVLLAAVEHPQLALTVRPLFGGAFLQAVALDAFARANGSQET